MPKLHSGRLNGLHGMRSFTADYLYRWADRLEAQAGDTSSPDDRRWLRRWARRMRALAQGKDKAAHQKAAGQRRRGLARRAEGSRRLL